MIPGRYQVKGGNDCQIILQKQSIKKLKLTSFLIDRSEWPKNMLICRLLATDRSPATYSGTAGARQLGKYMRNSFNGFDRINEIFKLRFVLRWGTKVHV